MENHSPENLERPKPSIIIGNVDHDRLTGLVTDALERIPDVAEELLLELERAKVVDPHAVPANTIQMGSKLEYRSDDGKQHGVVLVFPGEADIAVGKVSVLTPIGAALIGLSAGQSIDWVARDGRIHQLTILSVEQPER
jgi:regulator of nucleoside diphosphate kinase